MTSAPARGPSTTRCIARVHFHLPHDGQSALFEQLLTLMEGITPRLRALPPDSIELDLTGALTYFRRDAAGLAQLVRLRALALYGVPSTAAVGPNAMLAAMAAATTPPGQITVLGSDPYAIAAFLRPQPVAALHGVGPSTARQLARVGLTTVGELADAPLLTVQRLLGAENGRTLHERAHGVDQRPFVPQAPVRTAGCEHSFARDELDPEQHRRALLALAEQLGIRLRGEQQVCRVLVLTVLYADRSTTTRRVTLPEATSHSHGLVRAAYGLYEALGLQRARVRSLGLRAELAPADTAHHQLSLDAGDEKARLIEAAADKARARFGPGAVTPATLAAPKPSARPAKQ
ncbi:DNA polymerase Y family protein [Streptomyces sp. NPDC054864]